MPDARAVLNIQALIPSSDAKRPCTTCVRSHSYAATHAPSGTDLPSHPECTYDEAADPQPPEPQDSSENRFERLEHRINELEALLREKERTSSSSSQSVSLNGFEDPSAFICGHLGSIRFEEDAFAIDTQPGLSDLSTGSAPDGLAAAATLGREWMNSSCFGNPLITSSASLRLDIGMEVVNSSWPKNLPTDPLLHHLIEAFFTFTPSASRMFHVPTFLASLYLPPTHPKFPLPAILHAMCALGSMYTAAVAPPPSITLPSNCTSNLTSTEDGRSGSTSRGTGSFGDLQIQAAKEAIEANLSSTADLFGILQAQVVISIWYWYNARYYAQLFNIHAQACIAFAVALRYAVPCGLNACPPFDSISSSDMTKSAIIPPAANAIEDEVRRNTFWVAYMMERHFAAINNFAMMLDDEDIAQMLPVRGVDFERGTVVPPNERQWSYQPDVIVNHLEDQTDSFILHVKASMLLSKVKVFNSRYRVKRHLGDPAMQPNPAGIPEMPYSNLIQAAPAFVELERLIATFKQSLPTKLKDPLYSGVLDVGLFTALSSVHFATIILHEGHANIGHPACVSSWRVLDSARAILNLLYEAYSTSHNLALLGVFPMVCWFVAGRALVRFLKAAINAESEDHIATLRNEVDFIRSVIAKIGESVPHAYHYAKMLNGYLARTCGKEYATPVVPPPVRRSGVNSSSSAPEGCGVCQVDGFGLTGIS
ncbi:hypothetical protein BD414DRAFT_420621 [Trametes punicea]|nr:hypothetical protein BD414DRAFT_420621 [Trametes punicea]